MNMSMIVIVKGFKLGKYLNQQNLKCKVWHVAYVGEFKQVVFCLFKLGIQYVYIFCAATKSVRGAGLKSAHMPATACDVFGAQAPIQCDTGGTPGGLFFPVAHIWDTHRKWMKGIVFFSFVNFDEHYILLFRP